MFPVANAWATSMENASSFDITIEGGGSSSGARRVCAGRSDPSHVDIGDMSRDWKSSEAVLLDDGYTFECTSSKIRVTQIQVRRSFFVPGRMVRPDIFVRFRDL